MPEFGDFEPVFGGPFAPAPGVISDVLAAVPFHSVDADSSDRIFSGRHIPASVSSTFTTRNPAIATRDDEVFPSFVATGLGADAYLWLPSMGIGGDGTTAIYDPTARPTPIDTRNVIDFAGGSIGGGMAGGSFSMSGLLPTNLASGGSAMTMLAGPIARRGILVSGATAWAATRGVATGFSAVADKGRLTGIVARLPNPLKTALKFAGAALVWEAVSSMFGDGDDGGAIAEIAALIEDGISDGSIMFRGGTDRFGQPVVPKYLTIGPLDGNNSKAWIHDRYYSSKSIASVKRRTDTAWFRGRRGATARKRR